MDLSQAWRLVAWRGLIVARTKGQGKLALQEFTSATPMYVLEPVGSWQPMTKR